MARKLIVEIIGDSRSLERAFSRSSRSASRFEASMVGAGRGISRAFAPAAAALGVGIGGRAIVNQLRGAVNAASDLNEVTTKTQQVFGASSAALMDWSRTAATSFGQSQRQALAAASSFGALLRPLGLTGEEAAAQSRKLTRLGSDLASFYNTDVQSALDAIRSGLVGEVEPLRRYGAVLSESAVQNRALADTGKRTAAELTAQDKVLARLQLIYRGTNIAAGDFARTSGGLANQQRTLTAQLDDLQTQLGDALLPAVTKVVTQFNKWLADPENKKKVLDTWTAAIDGIGKAATFAASAIGKMVDARNKIESIKGPSLLDIFGKGPSGRDVLGKIGITGATTDFVGRVGSLLGIGGGGAAGGATRPPSSRFFFTNTPPGAGMTPQGFSGAGSAPTPRTRITVADIRAANERTARGNQWFDSAVARMLDRAQDVPTLRGQIAKLRTIAGLIQERIAATRDVTRRLNLEDSLAGVFRQIRGAQERLAEEAKAAAEAAKQRQAETVAAMFDWLEFGVDRATLTDKVGDDLRALRRLNAAIEERIRQEGYTLELARRQLDVQQRIKAIRDRAKQDAGGDQTAFRHVSAQRLANMLGLGGDPRAVGLLAAVGRGGTLPSRSLAFAGAGGGGVVINGNVHVNGVTDLRELEDKIQKQARGRSHPRRGTR